MIMIVSFCQHINNSRLSISLHSKYKYTKCQHEVKHVPGVICPCKTYVAFGGHLKISWTLTAEIEIDIISRDHLIRIHVHSFMICCFKFIVNM